MKVARLVSRDYTIFEVNSPNPLIKLDINRSDYDQSANEIDGIYKDGLENIEISEEGGGILIRKPFGIQEHILGLGEKAFELDRHRITAVMWNTDAYSYDWHTDPLYVSIPFFISVESGRAKGYFVNSVSKLSFDIGVKEYDKIRILVPESSAELCVIQGPSIEKVLESYSALTGKTYLPPKWALGHQISRYSYYPQERVVEIVRKYKENGVPLSAIYLDIDYMDNRKNFTWDKAKFPDPAKMIETLHSMDVKVIAIIDAGIKLDQNYDIFREGLGHYCETQNHEIYCGLVWPGLCVFPDFYNADSRAVWKKWIQTFVKESGLDGIWLDMNEPALFNESRTMDDSALHRIDDGSFIQHKHAHNAYGYFEAMATHNALSEIADSSDDSESFVLSRSGCAGIQKFSAIWSGDNVSSWENLRLQIPLLLGLSMSGLPFIGCDLGGFVGRSDPELLTRFYQAAALFPLLRNHKTKEGNDQEIFNLPSRYADKIKDAISLRYSLIPYLYSLTVEAHRQGHPIIRPLAYEFPDDEDAFQVNDEYMVGKSLLYAPHLEKGKQEREVYLPPGRWLGWNGSALKINKGRKVITSDKEMPLYIREGSVIPTIKKIIVWGKSEFNFYEGKASEVSITADHNTLNSSRQLSFDEIEFKTSEFNHASIDSDQTSETRIEQGSTLVRIPNSLFQRIQIF